MPSVVDHICEEFERAWKQGEPRSIETVLQQCNCGQHERLLAKLLMLEVEQRQVAGQRPTMADYADRFPAHCSLIRSVLEAAPKIEDTVTLSASAVQREISPVQRSQQPAASHQNADRRSIGRYTVIGTLGRGGQADVYRAIHPTLPIEVAIKLMHTTLSEQAREALHEEAHILCDLDHPHIARIRDFDFDKGRPFMVLDFIRGRSLDQVAAAEPYSSHAAAAVVAKIARAIGFANSRGVIHRDLKPDNIVIDAAGEPKIIDFGISRLRSGITGVTEEANEVSGTLAYMSPEQADGITANTDHRVDVFALGAILYRLLVGRAPYAPMPLTLMLSIVRQGQWDVAALEANPAPAELKAICKRAMSSDPAQRYPTAEAMAESISQLLSINEVDTKEGLASNRARSPRAIAAILGVVAILIAIIYFSNLFGSGENDTATVAQESAIHADLIEQFKLVHIGNSNDLAEFSGSLLQYRPPRENDDIQVQAEFSEPVYCVLVALNPDGVKQLCYPSDSGVAQSAPIKMLRYPTEEDSAFGLTDGIGQQAFVLYASRDPLPAFDVWDSELVTASWPNPEVAGNWQYRKGQLEAIEVPSNNGTGTRGAERKTKIPTPLKLLCDRLRQKGSSDVRGVTFEVKPKL